MTVVIFNWAILNCFGILFLSFVADDNDKVTISYDTGWEIGGWFGFLAVFLFEELLGARLVVVEDIESVVLGVFASWSVVNVDINITFSFKSSLLGASYTWSAGAIEN